MVAKRNSSSNRKDGEITRTERTSANEQAASVLRNMKERAGNVIHITINDRTTIELSAHLSQEEINERVERYKKLHGSKV